MKRTEPSMSTGSCGIIDKARRNAVRSNVCVSTPSMRIVPWAWLGRVSALSHGAAPGNGPNVGEAVAPKFAFGDFQASSSLDFGPLPAPDQPVCRPLPRGGPLGVPNRAAEQRGIHEAEEAGHEGALPGARAADDAHPGARRDLQRKLLRMRVRKRPLRKAVSWGRRRCVVEKRDRKSGRRDWASECSDVDENPHRRCQPEVVARGGFGLRPGRIRPRKAQISTRPRYHRRLMRQTFEVPSKSGRRLKAPLGAVNSGGESQLSGHRLLGDSSLRDTMGSPPPRMHPERLQRQRQPRPVAQAHIAELDGAKWGYNARRAATRRLHPLSVLGGGSSPTWGIVVAKNNFVEKRFKRGPLPMHPLLRIPLDDPTDRRTNRT